MAEISEAAKQARREYHKQWRDANRDHVNERAKAWRDANPDKVKAANDRYWEKKAAQKAAK